MNKSGKHNAHNTRGSYLSGPHICPEQPFPVRTFILETPDSQIFLFDYCHQGPGGSDRVGPQDAKGAPPIFVPGTNKWGAHTVPRDPILMEPPPLNFSCYLVMEKRVPNLNYFPG